MTNYTLSFTRDPVNGYSVTGASTGCTVADGPPSAVHGGPVSTTLVTVPSGAVVTVDGAVLELRPTGALLVQPPASVPPIARSVIYSM